MDIPAFAVFRDKSDFHVSDFFQSLMGSFDYHSNVLLAFETRAEKSLPAVPPAKLEEMSRRFVAVLALQLCEGSQLFPLMFSNSIACLHTTNKETWR